MISNLLRIAYRQFSSSYPLCVAGGHLKMLVFEGNSKKYSPAMTLDLQNEKNSKKVSVHPRVNTNKCQQISLFDNCH